MNNKSIPLNDKLLEKIKIERVKKGWNKTELSSKVNKANNYISLIENGTIQNIKIEDLKKLLNIFYGFNNEQSEEFILNLSKDDGSVKPQDDLENQIDSDKQKKEIIYYDEEDQSISRINFDKLLDSITKGFNLVYDDNPKFAFSCTGEFMRNLHFDIGFMLALIRIPFYELKETDKEVRQKLYNEISDIVKKSIDEFVQKEESPEEI